MSTAQTRAGIWGRLEAEASAADEAAEHDRSVDLWDRLATMVDPAELRPRLAPDVEIKEFHLRWGNDYAMIANPRDLIHYRLEPGEVELVRLLDGTRTVKEIMVQRFTDSGDLELSGVADLVRQLSVGNFLDRPFVDVDEAVKRAIQPVTSRRRRAREFARTQSIEWQNADRLVRWFHRRGLKVFFNTYVAALAFTIAIAGFFAFISIVRSRQFELSGRSLALGFLILLALNYLLTFAHELGHATTLVHFGRRIKSAGFMIYFGSPAFFVESSDGLMLDRRQRLIQSAAGPYTELILAGVAAIVVWAFPDAAIAPTLYKFVILNYLVIFMNLVPLLELDGYWLLSDLIQVPDLRPMSLSFIRHDLWHRIRTGTGLTKQEWGLAVYGVLGVLFTIFSFYTAYFFWKEVFGGLVSRLWNGGAVTRILLVALAVLIGGPIIRGGIALARSLGRRWKALIARLRFRLESGWRVEAAELIDGLPLFDDVPVEALNDLAGRVRLRTFARNQPVVRQGERAEAFFVVRSGALAVIEENRETGEERTLRILGRGESFGEVALLQSALRSATVRAVDEAQVFEVDRGTFERLLADMVHLPDFAPTLQAVAELKELKPFAHLEPDELSELLARGGWVNAAPDEVIVGQGEVGDAFYAIRSGQADVFKDGELIRTLGPGAFFGEVALLLDVPRTASVIARTPMRLFRLDRQGFDRVVRDAFRKGTLDPSMPQDRVWQH